MTDVIVALDVGGTKTDVLVQSVAGRPLVEVTVPSEDWDAEPIADGVEWIRRCVQRVVPPQARIAAVGVGAQGLDTDAVAAEFTAALPWPSIAVNDAALLVPAAGFDAGLGVIAGTGSIGVGRDAAGASVITGGWGWVIGDEAGAAGIVREAARAALFAHDDGLPDDGLLAALLTAFAVGDAERLARAVNDQPTMDNWGPKAPAVFAAADAGSALAATVVDRAAASLTRLVDQLVARGAVGDVVVAAGSVIVGQPRLLEAFRASVIARHPRLSVHLLTEPPVLGALALARTLIH